MNIVEALSRYRSSVTSDEVSFAILCYLYSAPSLREDELKAHIGLSNSEIKSRLVELYKSGFITLTAPNSYKISPLATHVLAGLAADEYLVPAMLYEVAAPPSSDAAAQIYRILAHNDPSTKTSIRQKLVTIVEKLTSKKTLTPSDTFILFSLVEPDSRTRAILKTAVDQVKADPETSNWAKFLAPQIDVYDNLSKAVDESDALLRHAAASPSIIRHFSSAGKSYTAWRLFSYINSARPDTLLESCHRVNPKLPRVIIELTLRPPRRKNDDFLRTFDSAAEFWGVPVSFKNAKRSADLISTLFADAYEAKTMSELANFLDLLPPAPQDQATEKEDATLTELVAMIEAFQGRAASGFLKGNEKQRGRARRLISELNSLVDKKAPSSPS